jgi:heme-degrading monooxygenase HmoA
MENGSFGPRRAVSPRSLSASQQRKAKLLAGYRIRLGSGWNEGGLMPTISKDNKVATLINVFTVEPENQQKVVDMLVETTDRVMKHIPGFVSASIHKSLDGVRVVNYAQWRSKEDFEAMRNSPEAQKHMKPFFEIAKVDFHLYKVADAIEVGDAAAGQQA